MTAALLASKDIATLVNTAFVANQRGDFALAEKLCKRALKLQPTQAEAHFGLGQALSGLGNAKQAIESLKRTATLAANNPTAQNDVGLLLQGLGELELAEACYRRSLALDPDGALAHGNLGSLLHRRGNLDAAEQHHRRALELNPQLAGAHNNLGMLLHDLGRHAEAEAAYLQALALNNVDAEVHNNLGNTLLALGRMAEAESSFRRAIELRPEYSVAYSNLGNVLRAASRFEEAEACYRQALTIRPDDLVALSNLGMSLQNRHAKLGEAEDCFRKVIKQSPDSADAFNNLGILLSGRQLYAEAEEAYRKAIDLRPGYAAAYCNLAGIQMDQQRLAESEASLRKALAIDPLFFAAHSNLLLSLNYNTAVPWEKSLDDATAFANSARSIATPYTTWPRTGRDQDKLRVGLVSSDFRNHSVGYFLMGPLSHINADEIELFAYSTNIYEDAQTEVFKSLMPHWRQVAGLSDAELAARIHADQIDVLVDLAGHTAANRLPMFAWQPAPVQATWLGYLGTTGLQAMDWIIADAFSLPREQENHFTEGVWRLADCYICLAPPNDAPEVQPPPAVARGYLTFGSFNNATKMTDQVIEVWSQILLAVAHSRLFIKSKALADAATQNLLVAKFEARGIDPDRLVLAGQCTREEHFRAYHDVDIALDTFPYPGVTTSMESLWMGVPVLTLAGERFLERQGVTLLANAGLGDWIATSPEDYLRRAVAFANDLENLASLRRGMRARLRATPLFDSEGFARKLETAWRGMWRDYCERVDASGLPLEVQR